MTKPTYRTEDAFRSIEEFEQTHRHISRVYAAGRIEDKRKRFGVVYSILAEGDISYNSPITLVTRDGKPHIGYTGPYTLGCDHRCSHSSQRGTATHGSAFTGCCTSTLPDEFEKTISGRKTSAEEKADATAEMILTRSFDGIKKCDLLYAWIDDHECHGTLVEIGYAFAMGKPIVIAHPPHIKPEGELWFAFECATKVMVHDNAEAAFRDFIESDPSLGGLHYMGVL